jgi:2-keto-3-deoxy-L-rhamnonate aldolase RhmA
MIQELGHQRADITEKHMALVENATIRKLRAGGLALGFGVHHLRTAAAGMLAAAAGHDWLFIDMEHGAFSQDDVAQICIAALPAGITPIVRVCAGALDEGTRALDNGAAGVIVPHVDTIDQARRIAAAYRYPPLGSRSWGGPSVLFGYKAPGNAEAQAAINPEILVVAMIESTEGVTNAGAIAAVEGIDGLLIGTSDLTAELGISGQILHPRVEEAYRIVGAACRQAGKFLGMGGVYELDAMKRYADLGAHFILTGSDHAYILADASLRSAFFRKLEADRKAT